jgi:hypothetical protein
LPAPWPLADVPARLALFPHRPLGRYDPLAGH